MSDKAGILTKWFSKWGIILAKEQLHHSYTFWTMPILIFSPVDCLWTSETTEAGRSENLGGQSLMEHIFLLIWQKSGGRGKCTLASMVLRHWKSFMKLYREQLMFQFSLSWKVMFISNDIIRKWNRMGSLLKIYIRIFTVVFVAIFVLSLDKLSRKRKSYEYRTTLDQRIQERIQRGMLINDSITFDVLISEKCISLCIQMKH